MKDTRNCEQINTSRRAMLKAAPAAGIMAMMAGASHAETHRAISEPWLALIEKLKALEVPHRIAGYSVVRSEDLEAIYSAVDAVKGERV